MVESLSQEHLQFLDLLEEIKNKPHQERGKVILNAWNTDLTYHFAGEEKEVFPKLSANGHKQLVQKLIADHKEIKNIVDNIRKTGCKDKKCIDSFTDKIKKHIQIEEMEFKQKGGMIKGNSHDNGGVPFTVIGTGQAIEAEGKEFIVCGDVMNNAEKLSLSGQNVDVLNAINKNGGCHVGKADSLYAGDFIICKKAILDTKEYSYSGTVAEIVSEMNLRYECNPVSGYGSKMEKGGLIDSANFKKWFGDSKVVDEDGSPLVVYHGSQSEFTKFEDDAYFTDDWFNADGYASGEYVYEVYLSIQNPLLIDAKGKKWDDIETQYGTSTREVVGNLDRNKYDGVIFNNIKDSWIDDEDYQDPSTVYVVLKSNQVKSATDNDGNYNPTNPDITKEKGGQVKFDYVMNEWKEGKLHHGTTNEIVKYPEQRDMALAIAYSESGMKQEGGEIKPIVLTESQKEMERVIEAFRKQIRENINPVRLAKGGNVEPMRNKIRALENVINEEAFVKYLTDGIKKDDKYGKRSLEKEGFEYGIKSQNDVKELAELSIVMVSREISLGAGTVREKYDAIVHIYQNQVNLSHRTSQSIALQQYSTPAPIGYIAGLFCGFNKDGLYFESSAGNGLLTIAGKPDNFIVNEIDERRLANLKMQGFKEVINKDATYTFKGFQKKFDAVITNPPFGTLDIEIEFGNVHLNSLEQVMALRCLETMKDEGRAAFIIGGHTEFDSEGRIQAGKNRKFFFYLFQHFNVVDMINISGRDLYSRQGTQFNTRLILIDGRKKEVGGYPPLIENVLPSIEPMSYTPVKSFDILFNRISKNI